LKAAIVKVGNSYRELDCIESPEVLFVDKMDVEVSDSTSVFVVDPIFVEVCEPGTIRVVSATPSLPVAFGARMLGTGSFEIRVSDCRETVRFALLLCGIRKGFLGRRFSERTEEECRRNTEFWKKI